MIALYRYKVVNDNLTYYDRGLELCFCCHVLLILVADFEL